MKIHTCSRHWLHHCNTCKKIGIWINTWIDTIQTKRISIQSNIWIDKIKKIDVHVGNYGTGVENYGARRLVWDGSVCNTYTKPLAYAYCIYYTMMVLTSLLVKVPLISFGVRICMLWLCWYTTTKWTAYRPGKGVLNFPKRTQNKVWYISMGKL